MTFDSIVAYAGFFAAAALIIGLIAGQQNARWRIWPAPPGGSARSFAFWTLFRTLNVAALILGVGQIFAALTSPGQHILQLVLAAIALAAMCFYIQSLWSLGKKATYCQASGLETEGIYRFSRNPQYATAILAFAAVGIAAQSWIATTLCAAMVAVYTLMAIVEEPWLSERYGESYQRYKAEVPRFFNVRHAWNEAYSWVTKRHPELANTSKRG